MALRWFGPVLLVGPAVPLLWLLTAPSQLFVLNTACANAIAVVGLAFVLGLSGQMVLSQAAFVGIGAYATAILSTRFDVPAFLTIPAAGLAAVVLGVVVGYPCLRLTGHYLALATIGFGIIAQLVFQNWTSLTNGTEGMSVAQPASILGLPAEPATCCFLVEYAALLATTYVFTAVRLSHWGRLMAALRQNELAASSLGIDVARYKMIAFALCAFFGGVAGSLTAINVGFVSPEGYGLDFSVVLLVMVVIGGASSVYGAVFGGLLLTFLPEWLRPLKTSYLLVYGALLMALVVFLPDGLSGAVAALLQRAEALRPGNARPARPR